MQLEGNLLKRVLSAAVLIPIIVYMTVYSHRVLLAAATAFVIYLALREFIDIVRRINASAFAGVEGAPVAPYEAGEAVNTVLTVIAGLCMPLVFYGLGAWHGAALAVAAVFVFFAAVVLRGAANARSYAFAAGASLALIYVALPLSYLIALRDVRGEVWTMFAFVVIWVNDAGALFAGKTLGRNKLCPSVSPGKTVEGAIGGILAGVAAALVFNRFAAPGATYLTAAILSVAIGVVGIFGDLAESVLKRAAGVKDSGSLIPGHGGMLDRLDSLVFTFPLLYYFLLWRDFF